MKKKIGYTLLSIIVIIAIIGYIGIQKFNNFITKETPNYLTHTYESKPILFEWTNDSIGNYYERQTAIIIPLKIEGLAHRFYMQFDTGSPFTIIYENDLKSLKLLGIDIQEVLKRRRKICRKSRFLY